MIIKKNKDIEINKNNTRGNNSLNIKFFFESYCRNLKIKKSIIIGNPEIFIVNAKTKRKKETYLLKLYKKIPDRIINGA